MICIFLFYNCVRFDARPNIDADVLKVLHNEQLKQSVVRKIIFKFILSISGNLLYELNFCLENVQSREH